MDPRTLGRRTGRRRRLVPSRARDRDLSGGGRQARAGSAGLDGFRMKPRIRDFACTRRKHALYAQGCAGKEKPRRKAGLRFREREIPAVLLGASREAAHGAVAGVGARNFGRTALQAAAPAALAVIVISGDRPAVPARKRAVRCRAVR